MKRFRITNMCKLDYENISFFKLKIVYPSLKYCRSLSQNEMCIEIEMATKLICCNILKYYDETLKTE